eukprot:15365682-Ditylum_brightwellii.AAC.1
MDFGKGTVHPDNLKSSVNIEGDKTSEEETKCFELNDPLVQACRMQYLNDTVQPNSKICTVAVSSSVSAAGDYRDMNSPDDEVLLQSLQRFEYLHPPSQPYHHMKDISIQEFCGELLKR